MSKKFKDIEIMDWEDDPTPPQGGWREPDCSFEGHKWTLEIEQGHIYISCVDPCDPKLFNPNGRTPICIVPWESEDYITPEPIPVKLTYVDESTPSSPAGPVEYGFCIEVRKS